MERCGGVGWRWKPQLESDKIDFRYRESSYTIGPPINTRLCVFKCFPGLFQTKTPQLCICRALEMIEAFFTNVLNDASSQEDLRQHIRDAYKCTLQPFHGWIVQEAFSVRIE